MMNGYEVGFEKEYVGKVCEAKENGGQRKDS